MSVLKIPVKKGDETKEDFVYQLENLIITKSWWDTFDGLAGWIAGFSLRNIPLLSIISIESGCSLKYVATANNLFISAKLQGRNKY